MISDLTETPGGLLAAERARFAAEHPRSVAMARAAASAWRGGAPASIFVAQGVGAQVTDVDGKLYDDFRLGDMMAMFGHGDASVAAALADQVRRGASFASPIPSAVIVGKLLAERFGLPLWQAAATASEAGRAAIAWARAMTGRAVILVFDGGCHEALENDAAATRVVAFNDPHALEAALAPGDVAAVLAEPALTRQGTILPKPGFHDALRRLTRRAGTLLIIDERHTIAAGPGGYVQAHGLSPDALVLGEAVGGGVPVAVWGVAAESPEPASAGAQGLGASGLAGGALATAAMRAMLSDVMTKAAYDRMLAGAERLAAGLEAVIASRGLRWSVVRLGARVELVFAGAAPANASDLRKTLDPAMQEALHLWLINRGVLIAPRHGMMLVSPVTEDAAVDRLVTAVDGFAAALGENCL